MLMPQTFMNDAGALPGRRVARTACRFDRVLVLHDEIDLRSAGALRLGGGLAATTG